MPCGRFISFDLLQQDSSKTLIGHVDSEVANLEGSRNGLTNSVVPLVSYDPLSAPVGPYQLRGRQRKISSKKNEPTFQELAEEGRRLLIAGKQHRKTKNASRCVKWNTFILSTYLFALSPFLFFFNFTIIYYLNDTVALFLSTL